MIKVDTKRRSQLIVIGRRVAETLGQSVADKPGVAVIETDAASLRSLSQVIDSLVKDANCCGGLDCMGRSIDGVRLWVTRDRFETLEHRAARLKTALTVIGEAGGRTGGEYDMLIDWHGTVGAMVKIAQQALAAPAS